MIEYGEVLELPDDEVQRLDAQDLAQRRDNVAAGAAPTFCRSARPYLGSWWHGCDRQEPQFFSLSLSSGQLVACVRMKYHPRTSCHQVVRSFHCGSFEELTTGRTRTMFYLFGSSVLTSSQDL